MIERYTRKEMGAIWQDQFKYETWLKIEILAVEARALRGEVPEEDLKVIKEKAAFEVERVNEIELTTNHDVIAFLTNVAEHVGAPSRHIHYGMTSSDILDTALSYQMKTAGELLLRSMKELLGELRIKALEYKNTVCIGRTHGIHAELTTFGLKFALWYEEMKRNITRMENAVESVSVGQISGAVGTFDYLDPWVEEYVCKRMGLKPDPITTQVIQRDRHAEFMSAIAITGATLEKIATEIRHLQRTEVLEAEEYFSKGQKGSSAMPHKRNPIISERICGMARLLRSNLIASIENIALWHERDISHSSVERVAVPDSCITLDYILDKSVKLIRNLLVYPENMTKNVNLTRGLVYSQKVLLALTKKGISREEAYSIVQSAAMPVWRDTDKNMLSQLKADGLATKYLSDTELEAIFNPSETLKNVDEIYKRTVSA
ncbi:MAG: adenylosuccinate lyase [Ignavibacteriaceae bacterium]|nr:adenylosuccinate lyase [Ignavibacteriaceae bacterium]